ncbi:hypothetical protein MN608_00281 [Microdochium nivale]|nr:hypothetical protein MN608_00281 [Microdochium nivale]
MSSPTQDACPPFGPLPAMTEPALAESLGSANFYNNSNQVSVMATCLVRYIYRCGCINTASLTCTSYARPRNDSGGISPAQQHVLGQHLRSSRALETASKTTLLTEEDCHDCWAASAAAP